jgi:hypothetical protein
VDWEATAKAVQEWGLGLAVNNGALDPGESGLVEESAKFALREAQPDVRIAFLGLIEATAEPITEVVTTQKVAAREPAQHAATECRRTGGGRLRHYPGETFCADVFLARESTVTEAPWQLGLTRTARPRALNDRSNTGTVCHDLGLCLSVSVC